MKTKEEIKKEIKRLIKEQDNFCSDNYGSEASDNGYYEVQFSEDNTKNTLNKFAEWIQETDQPLNDMVTDVRITVIKRFVKKLITELENKGLGEHICIKYISEFSKRFIQEEIQ